MRSHFLLIFLPFVALAEEVLVDFVSEHHQKHAAIALQVVTRDGKIRYVDGEPKCPIPVESLSHENLKWGSHLRFRHLDNCVTFFVCDVTGQRTLNTCSKEYLQVFDEKTGLCIYYK